MKFYLVTSFDLSPEGFDFNVLTDGIDRLGKAYQITDAVWLVGTHLLSDEIKESLMKPYQRRSFLIAAVSSLNGNLPSRLADWINLNKDTP